MKAKVDSKEFATAMGNALKWTRVTGIDVTGLVLLRVIDNYLLIRTTVGDGDSILAVNAFGAEHGEVMTRAAYLKEFAWATSGMVTIEANDGQLQLLYEDFASPLLATVTEADWPRMLNVEHSLNLSKDILLAAAAHTQPFAKTGMPMKSAVHIVPTEYGAAILGVDGVVGYRGMVEGIEVDRHIAIEAITLQKALGGIEGMISVGIKDHRIEVASRDTPSRIQFSSFSSPEPTNVVSFFDVEPGDGVLTIPKSNINRLSFLAGKAAAVDEDAEIVIASSEGTVVGRIVGQDVEIPEFEICEGESKTMYFWCRNLARSLNMVSDAEEYTVFPYEHQAGHHQWFIDGGLGRHFIFSIAPKRFATT